MNDTSPCILFHAQISTVYIRCINLRRFHEEDLPPFASCWEDLLQPACPAPSRPLSHAVKILNSFTISNFPSPDKLSSCLHLWACKSPVALLLISKCCFLFLRLVPEIHPKGSGSCNLPLAHHYLLCRMFLAPPAPAATPQGDSHYLLSYTNNAAVQWWCPVDKLFLSYSHNKHLDKLPLPTFCESLQELSNLGFAMKKKYLFSQTCN